MQPLAHAALGVPAGNPKKTDAAVTQEQLDTVDKFKGDHPPNRCQHPSPPLGCCRTLQTPAPAGRAAPAAASATFCMLCAKSASQAEFDGPLQCHPARLPELAAAESAYKCGVQLCFTMVLLLVGLNKP